VPFQLTQPNFFKQIDAALITCGSGPSFGSRGKQNHEDFFLRPHKANIQARKMAMEKEPVTK